MIIAADNDEPGRKAARAAAERFALSGHEVRIATPYAHTGVKKFDWNDALLSGQSLEKLQESFAKARRITAPPGIRAKFSGSR